MNKYHSRYFQTIDEKGRIVLPGKLRRVAEAEIGTTGTKIQFLSLIHISEPTRPY